MTERPRRRITTESKEDLWYNVARLWYRSIGIDYGGSGYSVVRYLPKDRKSVTRYKNMRKTCHGLVQPGVVDEEVHSGGWYMMFGSVLERMTFCCAKAGRSRPRARHIRKRESGMEVKGQCRDIPCYQDKRSSFGSCPISAHRTPGELINVHPWAGLSADP